MNFNTSHVVVYRISEFYVYSSFVGFQYISCCSLSCRQWEHLAYLQDFNTSHVVVYQVSVVSGKVGKGYFNTSHVVVYRASSVLDNAIVAISIHLML